MEKAAVTHQSINGSDTEDRSIDTQPQRAVTGFSWAVVVLAVLSSVFLCALDNSVVATVRPSIIGTFGHIDLLPWMSVSYVVANLGVNPTWGKLYTHFGCKQLYLIATTIFEIGSALKGAAQNMAMFILGQIISGLGASGVYVGTINILSKLTTTTERAQYLNFLGMAWSLSNVLGPLVGGSLANSSATWRWAFYLNLCVAAVAIPICVFLIPQLESSGARTGVRQRLKQIDWFGAVLFLAATFTTVMIFAFGGTIYPWRSGRMTGFYVSSAVLWLAFCIQQYFELCPGDRIFPAQFVPEPLMINLFSWTAIAISNLFITVFTLPLLFQYGLGFSPLRAAVFMLPYIGACVTAAGMSGPLIAKYPIYMAWFAGAAVFMLVGNALLTTITVHTSAGVICAYTIIQGIGGAVIQLPFTVAQIKKKTSQQTTVTAFLSCAQTSGLVVAIGVSTCIFLNQTTDKLVQIIPDVPRDLVQAAIEGLQNDVFQGLSTDARAKVLAAIVKVSSYIFYMNVASASFGLITALLMPRERLDFQRKA